MEAVAVRCWLAIFMLHRCSAIQIWSRAGGLSLNAPRANSRMPRMTFPQQHSILCQRTRGNSRKFKSIVMMPEGPEVRSLVDELQGCVGKRLVDFKFVSGRYVDHGRPRGFDSFASTMTQVKENPGRTDIINSVQCKGKFIYFVLDSGDSKSVEKEDSYLRSIWITLGMTGQFLNQSIENTNKSGPRWYIELMDTETGTRSLIYYRDTRNFGTLRFSLSEKEFADKIDSLGPDMLDVGQTTEDVFLSAMIKSSQRRNVCKFLMDQSKISGIGNYILAEGLYRARIDPFAALVEISTEQRRRLFKELRDVIVTSYESQGLTRPNGGTYRSMDGSKGGYEFELQCYGQTLSPLKFPIIKDTRGPHGRTIWYSPQEQLFMSKSQRNNDISSGEVDTKTDSSIEDLTSAGPAYVLTNIQEQLIDPGWSDALAGHMESDSFQNLVESIRKDAMDGVTIYPPASAVFLALNTCTLDKVKVVIVGQDPYHGPGQASGLAFSVNKGVVIPPSLKNIFKEAGIERPKHGFLGSWAEQGVLLLNSALTVKRGKANSHGGRWQQFTDEVINIINEQKRDVVFLLWGSSAHKKAKQVDEKKHTVIKTSHPSPLGATKTASPFLQSKCFSRANEALVASGNEPINWDRI